MTSKYSTILLAFLAIPALSFAAVSPATLSFPENGQFNLPVSNSNPNLIVVPGDRITAVNSADGTLTDQRNTEAGALLVSTLATKPFTFFVETEKGQVFSITAVPEKRAGASYRLVSESTGENPKAKAWEQSQPYESLLIGLNQAVRRNAVPEGYAVMPVTHEQLKTPAGLTSRAVQVWMGDRLKVTRFDVRNTASISTQINEHDFWAPSVRSIMFSSRSRELSGGGTVGVYVTTDLGGNDGQH
ncbi:type-F conjugative transfer system secretin TraK [Serratia liquefaciens]|uniref:type-F conjugative transfer system secretin TraK n=1 Tax=Serratia liquefaciens TaxID=614 RepID=UPI0032DE3121